MTASLIIMAAAQACTLTAEPALTFHCRADNDLYAALVASGVRCSRFDSTAEAIEQATPGSPVLILADGYPEQMTHIDQAMLDRAAAGELPIYIEYPHSVPGLSLSAAKQAQWERAVVTDGNAKPFLPMQIMTLHECRYTAMAQADTDKILGPSLVLARVAGFDTAVFGLPEQRVPILFELKDRHLLVATTKLSGFVTGRYAPSREWRVLWEHLLTNLLNPLGTDGKRISLEVTPVVRPAYGPDEPLPADVERRTLRQAAEWYFKSRLLIHPSHEKELHAILSEGRETAPVIPADALIGDGTCGIQEGYASGIHCDGNQDRRPILRADCNAETAMCLAMDWAVNRQQRSQVTARNLLDYVFFKGEFCRGVRGDPKHPAYGLVAWGAVAPLWRIANYGDDDARVLQSAVLASACLQTNRWDAPILRGLLANLRTTGPLGFRGSRIDIAPLEKLGWKHFHDAQTINYAPHYEAALWTCYLWAFARTNHQEFLDKAKSAMRMTMEAYPDKWMWQNDIERARMVLALAWLVRVEDTSEHRAWLKRMVDDLLAHQDACGAIPCRLGVKGNGHFLAPTRNEEYGTREVPLIQENGDPVSDQLYTTGFALIALHEAAAATRDEAYRKAEDRIAQFVCRTQVRSDRLPYLDGGWFRAFDYKRWDYWAGSGDIGWGAWCIEAGWAQAWSTAALGLRIKNTSIWDLTAASTIGTHLQTVQEQMAANDGGPWTGPAYDPAATLPE
jgi:hypothetical protein